MLPFLVNKDVYIIRVIKQESFQLSFEHS